MSIVESNPSAGTYARVPGPIDRESFFAAQARNRRTSWRLTALCVLAVLILGIPLSTILGPLFYGLAVLAMDVVNLFTPTPDLVHRFFEGSLPLPSFGDSAFAGYAVIVLVLAPPGALFLLLVWLGTRGLLLRAGAGGILLSLGAREPKRGDLEETQLVNLVAEMGIAAGVPPPRVLLLDTRAVNAAVVGSSLEDGAVVVSRGLLDALDRDETQGVIGHLIGSMGNGDLRIAMTMLSLYQTLGVIVAALSSPFSPSGRTAFQRLARFALQKRGAGPADAAESEAVTQLLATGLDGEDFEVDDLEKEGWKGSIKGIAALPFLAAYFSFWINQKVLGSFLVSPPLALVWRSRRYLADATAVQLTRNPDGLARALLRLSRPDAEVPKAAWASHLFVAWPGKKGTLDDKLVMFGKLQPGIDRRLRRLKALGSTVSPPPPPPPRRGKGRKAQEFQGMKPLAWVLASPLILCFAGVLIGNALATVGVSLAIDGLFFFGLFVIPLHFLLRYLAQSVL